MDFNHRKQLGWLAAPAQQSSTPSLLHAGTLVELWSIMAPHLTRLDLLILSVGSMVELAELEVPPRDWVPFCGLATHASAPSRVCMTSSRTRERR